MNNINLNSFLKFGYFLDYQNPNITFDFSRIDKEKYKNYSEEELINTGIKLWKEAIQKQFNPNEKHVVPLSGGLDSRAILATLLEFTEAKNIYTYTFGTPRTLDYDIGNLVAKKVGTNHIKFPLTEHKYTVEEEIDVSKRSNKQSILFHHSPLYKSDNLFANKIIWSGFLGDTVGGSHSNKFTKGNIRNAKLRFLERNKFVKSTDLSNRAIENFIHFVEFKKLEINNEEIINLLNGEIKNVAPYLLVDGFNFKLPHIDKNYMGFMLSVSEKFRFEQRLYKNILFNLNKQIFKIKIKNRRPTTFQRVGRKFYRIFNIKKYLNYIDFDNGIRDRSDLNKIIYESIMDLKKRKTVDWIDIDGIWDRHINKKANHADALLVLASLEIHLKAGKKL